MSDAAGRVCGLRVVSSGTVCGLRTCLVVDGAGRRTSVLPSLAAINDQLRTGTDKGNLTV